MSKPSSIFAGGWTPAKAAILNNIKLPEKTRCKVCHKIKNISNFSNKQLLDLKHRIAGVHGDKAKSPIAEIIACRACTQGSVHELTCCICNEPKSLDGFAKAQRKDPDNARCLLCVNQHVTEPWAHVEQDDDEDDSSDDQFSDTVSNRHSNASYRYGSDVNTTTSALKAVNLSEHDKSYSCSADKKEGSSVATESDLLGSYSESGKGKGKEKENFGAGYGSAGSPWTTGSERSLQMITENRTEKSGFARPRKVGNSGFANPPPGPPQRRPDDILDHLKATEPGRTVSYSDSSDSDSDGSFGML
ncbi:MAG: hypothetical protein Q9171_003838 [Xanthocarpia ochracea]